MQREIHLKAKYERERQSFRDKKNAAKPEDHQECAYLPHPCGGEDNRWLKPKEYGTLVELPAIYPADAMDSPSAPVTTPKRAYAMATSGTTCINIPLWMLRPNADTLAQFVYAEEELGNPDGVEASTTRFITAALLSAIGLHECEGVKNGTEYQSGGISDAPEADTSDGVQANGGDGGRKALYKKQKSGAPAKSQTYRCKHPALEHMSVPMRWFGIEHLVAKRGSATANRNVSEIESNAIVDGYVHVGYRVWFLRWDPTYSETTGLHGLMGGNAKQLEHGAGISWWKGSVLESAPTDRPDEDVNVRDRKFINNALRSISNPSKAHAAFKIYGGELASKKVVGITGINPYSILPLKQSCEKIMWSLSPDDLLDGSKSSVLKANMLEADNKIAIADLLPAQQNPLSYFPWHTDDDKHDNWSKRHLFVCPPIVSHLQSFALANLSGSSGDLRNCMAMQLPPSPVASNATPPLLLELTKQVVSAGMGNHKKDPAFTDLIATSTEVQDAFLAIADAAVIEHLANRKAAQTSERARAYASASADLGESRGHAPNPTDTGVTQPWPQRETRARITAVQNMLAVYKSHHRAQNATSASLAPTADLRRKRVDAADETLLDEAAAYQRAINEWSVGEVLSMLRTQSQKLPAGLMSKAKQGFSKISRTTRWPRNQTNESSYSCFGAFIQKLTLFSNDRMGWTLDAVLFQHMYFSQYESILDSPKWVCMYFGERAVGKSHAVVLLKEMLLPNTFADAGSASAKQGMQGKCLESGHVLVYDEAPTATTGAGPDPERLRILKEMLSNQQVVHSRCQRTDSKGKDEFIDFRYVTEHQEKIWYFANTSFMLDFCKSSGAPGADSMMPSSSTLALLDRHAFIFCRPARARRHGAGNGGAGSLKNRKGSATLYDDHHLLDGLASLLIMLINCMPTLDPAQGAADEMFARYDHILETQHGAPPIESREAHGRSNLYKVICAVYAVHLRFFDMEGLEFAKGEDDAERLANFSRTTPPVLADLLDCAPILAAPPPELIFYVHSLHAYTRLGLAPFFDHIALGLAETFSSTTKPTERAFAHRPNSELFGVDRACLNASMPSLGKPRAPSDDFAPNRSDQWANEWVNFPATSGRKHSISKSIYHATDPHDLVAMEKDTELRLRQTSLLFRRWSNGDIQRLSADQERMLLPSLGYVVSVCAPRTIQRAIDASMAPKEDASGEGFQPVRNWSTPYSHESSVHFASTETSHGTRWDFSRLQTTRLGKTFHSASMALTGTQSRCGRLSIAPEIAKDCLQHWAWLTKIKCRRQPEVQGFKWKDMLPPPPAAAAPKPPGAPEDAVPAPDPASVPDPSLKSDHKLHSYSGLVEKNLPPPSLPGLLRHLGENTWLDQAVSKAVVSGHLAGLSLGCNDDEKTEMMRPFCFERSGRGGGGAGAAPAASGGEKTTSNETATDDGTVATLSVAFKRQVEMAEAQAALSCKHIAGAGRWIDTDMADPTGEAHDADLDDLYPASSSSLFEPPAETRDDDGDDDDDDDDDEWHQSRAQRPHSPCDGNDDGLLDSAMDVDFGAVDAQGEATGIREQFNTSAKRKTGVGSWWNMMSFHRMLTCAQAGTWHVKGAPPLITPITSPFDQTVQLVVPLDREDPNDDPLLLGLKDYATNLAYCPKTTTARRDLDPVQLRMLHGTNSAAMADEGMLGDNFDWYCESDSNTKARRDPYPSSVEQSLRDRCLLLPDKRLLVALLSVRNGKSNESVRRATHSARTTAAKRKHEAEGGLLVDFKELQYLQLPSALTPEQIAADTYKRRCRQSTTEDQKARDRSLNASVRQSSKLRRQTPAALNFLVKSLSPPEPEPEPEPDEASDDQQSENQSDSD